MLKWNFYLIGYKFETFESIKMKFIQVLEEFRKRVEGATEKYEKLKGKADVGHSKDEDE